MLARVSGMPEPSFDVAACVQRVRQRDEDAARELFRHLYPLVARLVRSHLPRRTSQEDLVQTVFMKVFANLDRFSGTVPLEHWVSRIAINTCLNQLAAEKARPELRWADLSEEQTDALEAVTAGTGELDPLQKVQRGVHLLFETFRQTGSALRVVHHFKTEGVLWPRRITSGVRTGELLFGPLEHSRVLGILHNPRYTGAFVYGRTRQRKVIIAGQLRYRRLKREEWSVFLPNMHP